MPAEKSGADELACELGDGNGKLGSRERVVSLVLKSPLWAIWRL